MISRKEKILWLCFAVVLVVLFLLSSTDLIIKEREQVVYPVSVIIDGARDDNYVNFRKGMDRAAIDLNADVSFITLYEENSAAQQLGLMNREQQDGTRALVVMPVEEALVDEALVQKQIAVPTVLVNGGLPGNESFAAVTVDYQTMGRQLAGQIADRYPADTLVCLFRRTKENTVIQNFEQGICDVLEARGMERMLVPRQGDQTFRRVVEELAYQQKQVVLVGLDPGSLTDLAAILADRQDYSQSYNQGDGSGGYIKGLYGRGTSISILNYLDKGIISGLCVTDDFSVGYLSVKQAVDALNGHKKPEQIVLESYYIEKDDLRMAQYEKMLYPIE